MALCNPISTWNSLKEGNQQFVRNKKMKKRRQLVENVRKPCAIVLSCADSRVPPELIFNQDLGQLFVIRVAGNTVDKLVLDSIAFAVKNFKPSLIIVLGHTQCAALAGAVEHLQHNNGKPNIAHEHFGAVLIPIERAIVEARIDVTDQDALRLANLANIRHSAHYLTAHSPIIKDALAQKSIQIIGALYSLETGIVTETFVIHQ